MLRLRWFTGITLLACLAPLVSGYRPAVAISTTWTKSPVAADVIAAGGDAPVATGVNSNGVVVGYDLGGPGGEFRGWRWDHGIVSFLQYHPDHAECGLPVDVTDDGEIVGWVGGCGDNPAARVAIWSGTAVASLLGVLATGGDMDARPTAASSHGKVSGRSTYTDTGVYGTFLGFVGDTSEGINPVPGSTSTVGVNNSGQVIEQRPAGLFFSSVAITDFTLPANTSQNVADDGSIPGKVTSTGKAGIWKSGAVTLLKDPVGGDKVEARAIAANGRIFGRWDHDNNGTKSKIVIWDSPTSTPVELPYFAGVTAVSGLGNHFIAYSTLENFDLYSEVPPKEVKGTIVRGTSPTAPADPAQPVGGVTVKLTGTTTEDVTVSLTDVTEATERTPSRLHRVRTPSNSPSAYAFGVLRLAQALRQSRLRALRSPWTPST